LKRLAVLSSFRDMPHAAEQWIQFKKAIATPELPMLGPQRRGGTGSATEIIQSLDSFFRGQKIPESRKPLLRSAALLWHDHLDESHTISQGIETRDGSWLHGIMHRREPDYGNARYWFRRVAPHETFHELAERVIRLLADDRTGLATRLIEKGDWKPFAFIDECERAEETKDAALTSTLRKIQEIEFDVLVENILRS
jgi:hypothetical protein